MLYALCSKGPPAPEPPGIPPDGHPPGAGQTFRAEVAGVDGGAKNSSPALNPKKWATIRTGDRPFSLISCLLSGYCPAIIISFPSSAGVAT